MLDFIGRADSGQLPTGPFRRLMRMIPPLIVFGGLAALLAWGHRTGWALPKASWLWGAAKANPEEWCGDHGVPHAQCVECNPELLPRGKAYGWCSIHGVHECPLCHPEMAQVTTLAVVNDADRLRARNALAFTERVENNPDCKLHLRRIQFASLQAAEKAGVGVDVVGQKLVMESVSGNGELIYDQTRTARLSARAPGSVFRALKKVGDPVQRGELVALVDAAEVGKVKAEYQQALVQVRSRTKTLQRWQSSSSSIPEGQIRELETQISAARIRVASAQQALTNLGLPIDVAKLAKVENDQLNDRLRFLGLPAEMTKLLDPKTTTGNLLPIVSPFAGVVVAREAVVGEVVDVKKVLFKVVDNRQLWLILDLRSEDARSVAAGQKVEFRADDAKKIADGTIDWVSPEVDHKTRTVKVRALVNNAEGKLRANTFGTGKIILRQEPLAVVVPTSAVHWEGDCHIVFVRDKNYFQEGAPKVFHTRTVRPGAKDDSHVEIIAGLLPGEVVASKGSAALLGELRRASLGEG
jgi:cobalt-zinc-cadmium efflux system membrane fusion protein